jgi:hypothetical protein
MGDAAASTDLSKFLAAELCTRPEDADALTMADEHIRGGGGKALFEAMVGRFGREQLTQLMTLLEIMMEVDASVSAYLMARLHARVGRTQEQAIYDAIELWMSGLAIEEAARALVWLSNEGVRPALSKRCLEWADGIRKRAKLVER